MKSQKEDTSFKYTYSAKEQEEIKKIRQKYQAPEVEEDRMAKLRKLDASVTQKATCRSLVFGVLGALILGTGMSLIMTDLGAILGMAFLVKMVVGICCGLVGLVLVIAAYPVYHCTLKKEREKIAPEILKMTEDLMR